MKANEPSELELAAFQRDGYLIVRSLVDADTCARWKSIAADHVDELIAPVEYEIDVSYPGAPTHSDAPGAQTSRRLLQAFARDEAFREWGRSAALSRILCNLFDTDAGIMLSQCHHNCLMTKAPGYSSATLWHQDNRYWSFDRQDLISVWLALGDENRRNGCLRVIPGSHRLELDPGRFDASLFLRPDLAENKGLLAQAEIVELNEGDVLFFHSRLFHAAGRNLTDETKFSLVYTYHQSDNHPIAGTRSARFPSIPVA